MNGILVIDKEQEWTSQDVVSKLRGILGQKKIGHTGTLDPMATGVLPICIGKATKLSEFILHDHKTYIVKIHFGYSTTTQDAWGEIVDTSNHLPCENEFKDALGYFLGKQYQTPPMYSAIKIGGKKLYELARQGKTITRKPRQVVFYELKAIEFHQREAIFECKCSKGTYMRTLCDDIGKHLHCPSHMSGLRRIQSGCFKIEQSVRIKQLEMMDRESISKLILPMEFGLSNFPSLELTCDEYEKMIHGVKITRRLETNEWIKIYYHQKFIGLALSDGVSIHLKKLLI